MRKMEIELGLHSVADFIAYHISDVSLDIGEEHDTSNIHRGFHDCGSKHCAENLAEKYRISMQDILGHSLPSRLNSLFVCEREYVNYWYRHILKNRSVSRVQIYKVRLTGDLFGTFADYLKFDKYWDPQNQYLPQEKEGLFEGKYIVEDICNINDF